MFILLCRSYGTQERVITPIYKHCVPTGLKRTKVCTSVQKLYTPVGTVCNPDLREPAYKSGLQTPPTKMYCEKLNASMIKFF